MRDGHPLVSTPVGLQLLLKLPHYQSVNPKEIVAPALALQQRRLKLHLHPLLLLFLPLLQRQQYRRMRQRLNLADGERIQRKPRCRMLLQRRHYLKAVQWVFRLLPLQHVAAVRPAHQT